MLLSNSFKISDLFGENIKISNSELGVKLLMKNLQKDHLITDVSNVNYTKNEKLFTDGFDRTTLSPPTCEIMIIKRCSPDAGEGQRIQDKGKRNQFIIKNSRNDATIREIFHEFIDDKQVVIEKFDFLIEDTEAEAVTEVIENNYQDLNFSYVLSKLEIAEEKVAKLSVKWPEILNQLKSRGYFVVNLRLVQDLPGIFDKSEMEQFLTEEHDFVDEVDENDTDEFYQILKENCTNVLSWRKSNASVKIFNEFVKQLTNPNLKPGYVTSDNEGIGNDIIQFIENFDKKYDAFSKKHGKTTMETTIWNNNHAEDRQENNMMIDCFNLLEQNKIIMENAPMYSVSLSKMWKRLTEAVKNNCCVVFDDLLQFCLWGDSTTEKLTGIQIALPGDIAERNKIIRDALILPSFKNLPINYIEVVPSVINKDELEITYKCYQKMNGVTYLSKIDNLYSTVDFDSSLCSDDLDIHDYFGLTTTEHVDPRFLRKGTNIEIALSLQSIEQTKPKSTFCVLPTTTGNKRKMEETAMIDPKKRKLEYFFSDRSLDILKESELIKLTKSEIETVRLFQLIWDNLNVFDTYDVLAFTVNRTGPFDFVGVLAEKNGVKKVYNFKGLYKNLIRRIYYNRKNLTNLFHLIPYACEKEMDGAINWIRPKDDQDLICSRTGGPLFRLTTYGITQFNGNNYTDIVEVKFYLPINVNDYESVNNLLMDKIKLDNVDTNNPVVFRSIDELKNGAEVVVVGIGEMNNFDNNMKKRYVLQLRAMERDLFISNHWLEEEMKNLNLNFVFKIEMKEMKMTSNMITERFLSCSQFSNCI